MMVMGMMVMTVREERHCWRRAGGARCMYDCTI